MSETRFLAACVQLTSRADVDENLRSCARGIAEAAARGAKLVVLPENFAFMGLHENDKLPHAEILDATRPGPILATLVEAAKAAGAWVIGGGMPETAAAGKVSNSAVV